MMGQINISKYSPDHKSSPKAQYIITVVPATRRASKLEGGNYTKIGDMWTLKHEISSPILYELLIKIKLKGYTYLDLKNLYNHIKMCLNAVTILQE